MTLGIEQPAIRTEIFVQLMKQLRNNPDARCEARAWQLLMLCLLSFPPDIDLVNFVLMFIRENAQPHNGEALTRQCHAITTPCGLVNSGALWEETLGNSGEILGRYGPFWHTGALRAFWGALRCFGSLWNVLGRSGVIWSGLRHALERCGAPWDF